MCEVSEPIWQGLRPKKFMGNRRHIPEPSHQDFVISLDNMQSRRHLQQINLHDNSNKIKRVVSDHNLLAGQRFFPTIATKETVQNLQSNHKHVEFVPLPKFSKGEMVHLTQVKTETFEDLQAGKRTFGKIANVESQQQYLLENDMQRKVRVPYLEIKRNRQNNSYPYYPRIGIYSLGDKPYLSPEQTADFFKQPNGYIPGSNIQYRGQLYSRLKN